MNNNHQRSSKKLLKIVALADRTHSVYLEELLNILGERAFGLALLLLSLPSALPFSAIPGVSLVFSIPILIFAIQLILNRQSLWLPKFMAKRPIDPQTIASMIAKTLPYLQKFETILKPRWLFFTSRLFEILNGITISCVALVLMLPIPFSNSICGCILILFSLGLIEEDGLFILLGYFTTMAYFGFLSYFFLSAFHHLMRIFS